MILQENGAARNRGITLASIKGIIGNVVLVIFKMIVGLASNSIAIILDAVNNLTDVLSSVLTIVGTKLADNIEAARTGKMKINAGGGGVYGKVVKE